MRESVTIEADLSSVAAVVRAALEAPARQASDEWIKACAQMTEALRDAAQNAAEVAAALEEAAQRAAVESPLDRVAALRRLTDSALAAREMGKPVRPGYIRPETIERAAWSAARKGK